MKELSKKNEYWISKRRYLELKNFCLQYKEWLEAITAYRSARSHSIVQASDIRSDSKPTEDIVMRMLEYTEKIDMVREASRKTADDVMADFIFTAVTNGYSYEYMSMQKGVPCGRELYYKLYRRFFWELDKLRK